MLGVEGKDKVQEGWGARRRDKGGCEPLFFRTGRGTSGIPARVRHCSVRVKVGVCGSEGTARTCSSRVAFGSRSGSE